MNITKENNELVLRLPLRQNSYDAVGELVGETDNLIGVIAGNEYTISQLIDLGYKGDQQEGGAIINFNTCEELEDICKQFGIQIWEHLLCSECGSVIRGACTWGDKGTVCYKCKK